MAKERSWKVKDTCGGAIQIYVHMYEEEAIIYVKRGILKTKNLSRVYKSEYIQC